MAVGLRKKLRRLERSGRLPCSECGQYDDEPIKIKVTWDDRADSDPDIPEGPQYCSRCGRLCGGRIKLTWD